MNIKVTEQIINHVFQPRPLSLLMFNVVPAIFNFDCTNNLKNRKYTYCLPLRSPKMDFGTSGPPIRLS